MTGPFSLDSCCGRSIHRLPGAAGLAPVFLAALLLQACADNPTDPVPAASRILIEPDSVVLSPSSLSLGTT